jgi:single-strand DNA-binding protein
MSYTNFVAVDGNLTKDGEIKFTDGGTAVLNLSIAHNTKIKEKEEVSFFDIVAFGKHAEYVADFAVKGATVTVIGRLHQDKWEKEGKKYSRTKIIANQVIFGKVKAAKAETPPDDDIPF